jgi:hypothetical protein
MKSPLQIWLLADGKPGHVNQSLGLAEALGRRTPAEIHRMNVDASLFLPGRMRALRKSITGLPSPDLLIGAGHRTHLPMLWLGRRQNAPTVVLMRPTLPARLFGLCLVPRHDLGRGTPAPNVIPTIGALNRIVPGPRDQAKGRLILVGGPSAHHGWDGERLAAAIREIVSAPGDPPWEIADSRRTPDGFLASLAKQTPGPRIHPHGETGPDWLAERLSSIAEAWVTEDSVSMICEALTAGARVGALPMPKTKEKSRVVRGLEILVGNGYLTRFDDWLATRTLQASPSRLAEADRCAGIVLERFSSCHAG